MRVLECVRVTKCVSVGNKEREREREREREEARSLESHVPKNSIANFFLKTRPNRKRNRNRESKTFKMN